MSDDSCLLKMAAHTVVGCLMVIPDVDPREIGMTCGQVGLPGEVTLARHKVRKGRVRNSHRFGTGCIGVGSPAMKQVPCRPSWFG